MTNILLYNLVFLIVIVLLASFILVLWFFFISVIENRRFKRRLNEVMSPQKIVSRSSRNPVLITKLVKQAEIILNKFHHALNPKSKSIAVLLSSAGLRGKNALSLFVAAQIIMPLLLLSYFFMVPAPFGLKPGSLLYIVLLLFVVMAGLKIPYIGLEQKAKAYQRKIRLMMPDTIQIMVMCMDVGYSNEKILETIVDEFTYFAPEMANELEFTLTELKLLPERAQAWKNLSKRIDIEELTQLTAMLEQNDRFGVSITQSLAELMKRIKSERLLNAEEKAGKIPAKLTIPMAIFFLPILLILVISPAIVNVLRLLSH